MGLVTPVKQLEVFGLFGAFVLCVYVIYVVLFFDFDIVITYKTLEIGP